jgi:hypothetical protein
MSSAPEAVTVEATLVEHPLWRAWEEVLKFDLHYWDSVVSVMRKAGPLHLGMEADVKFRDGMEWTVRIVALSELEHSLSFEVTKATPALDFSSALHTVRLLPDTVNDHTFVQWSTSFSGDVSAARVEDSKYKRRASFAGLAAALKRHKA